MPSKEFTSVKGSLFLLQKAPSIRPLSFFYEENGSGALHATFGKKKFSFKSTAEAYRGVRSFVFHSG